MIDIKHISKTFIRGNEAYKALVDVSLKIKKGDYIKDLCKCFNG